MKYFGLFVLIGFSSDVATQIYTTQIRAFIHEQYNSISITQLSGKGGYRGMAEKQLKKVLPYPALIDIIPLNITRPAAKTAWFPKTKVMSATIPGEPCSHFVYLIV
jgi:hypothetical protein